MEMFLIESKSMEKKKKRKKKKKKKKKKKCRHDERLDGFVF